MPVETGQLELPQIPGGWTRSSHLVCGQTFQLAKPRDPDAFLDDTDVLAAHRRDDYMPYWSYLWPAAELMSPLILTAADWSANSTVLEIGSGIGLVGIVAASRGWKVTLSDYDETSLKLARHNAELNGYTLDAIKLDWRAARPEQFDNIIACDVLYEVQAHQPILDLLQVMLGQGEVWIGDPGRTHLPKFYHAAVDRGWKIRILTADGQRADWPRIGEFQVLILQGERETTTVPSNH